MTDERKSSRDLHGTRLSGLARRISQPLEGVAVSPDEPDESAETRSTDVWRDMAQALAEIERKADARVDVEGFEAASIEADVADWLARREPWYTSETSVD